MSAPVTKQSTDHSDRDSFSFSFFCDICGKAWRSPTVPFQSGGLTAIEHEEARQMIWANERKIAFEQANLEAVTEFNRCPNAAAGYAMTVSFLTRICARSVRGMRNKANTAFLDSMYILSGTANKRTALPCR